MLYSSKSTFLTFSSQIPTNSVNLTKFLPFLYMRNIEYLWGILSSHENYYIPTMRNGKTTEILSSLLWDSHKILWGIFVRVTDQMPHSNYWPLFRLVCLNSYWRTIGPYLTLISGIISFGLLNPSLAQISDAIHLDFGTHTSLKLVTLLIYIIEPITHSN